MGGRKTVRSSLTFCTIPNFTTSFCIIHKVHKNCYAIILWGRSRLITIGRSFGIVYSFRTNPPLYEAPPRIFLWWAPIWTTLLSYHSHSTFFPFIYPLLEGSCWVLISSSKCFLIVTLPLNGRSCTGKLNCVPWCILPPLLYITLTMRRMEKAREVIGRRVPNQQGSCKLGSHPST